MMSLSDETQADVIEAFNSTYTPTPLISVS